MTSVNISPQGLHLIASFEGWRPGWYKDSGGVETIGYGHTGTLPPGMVAPLTVAQGIVLLKRDAQIAVDAVNASVKVNLGTALARKQTRYDCLYCLTFNIGAGAFESSTLLREINLHGAPRDWTEVGPYWLEWDHVNGQVLPGLLTRRKLEFSIFRSGVYPAV